jgi:hypothetical protein
MVRSDWVRCVTGRVLSNKRPRMVGRCGGLVSSLEVDMTHMNWEGLRKPKVKVREPSFHRRKLSRQQEFALALVRRYEGSNNFMLGLKDTSRRKPGWHPSAKQAEIIHDIYRKESLRNQV